MTDALARVRLVTRPAPYMHVHRPMQGCLAPLRWCAQDVCGTPVSSAGGHWQPVYIKPAQYPALVQPWSTRTVQQVMCNDRVGVQYVLPWAAGQVWAC